MKRGKNRSECISFNIALNIKEGKPRDQAVAIATSHCNKIWSGGTKNEQIEELLIISIVNNDDLKDMILELQKIKSDLDGRK